MKDIFKIFQFLLLMCGVFGADENVTSVSVMEGDSVTLKPDPAQIQGFIQMLWRFGSPAIAMISGNDISDEEEERFRGRLQLDQTGSLTIHNMRTKHSGQYKAEISHSTETISSIFIVTVYESLAVIDAVKGEMKIMSVTAGNPVTLQTDVTELQGDELIVWRSGEEGKLIAKTDIEAKSLPLYDTDERFRDRLKLDQTGSLTITDTRNADSGLYKVKISNNKQTLYKRFTVTVRASGLSPGAVAGIVIGVLLVSAAVAAVVWYYRRPITTKLPKQTWIVPGGDNVTLNPETEIQKGDQIQWLFRDEDTLIAEIRRETREMKTYNGPDEIFMYTLTLDETGSLLIEFINIKLTGLYTLKIRRGRETLYKRFIVSVDEWMMRYVTEGNDVILHSDTYIKKDDEIQWLFGEKKQIVLAEIKNTDVTPYKGTDERFRDRLKVDKETGSLTIRKFTATNAGYYTLKIGRRTETLYKRFYLCVKAREITVTEGGVVTLNPVAEIKKDDLIMWLFGDKEQQTLIAEIKKKTGEIFTYDVADGRFRDRLKLEESGSLTITDTRTEQTGLYKLQIISSRGLSENIFFVTVKNNVEEKLVNLGESVTLKPDTNTEIQRVDQIRWMFGGKLIARIKGGEVEIPVYDDGVNKRFRGRLKLDETGSLTITDVRPEQTGLYKLQIISSKETLFKRFRVSINYKVEVKSLNVGNDVTLKPDTEIQKDDQILWMFGDYLIARIKEGEVERYDDGVNKRFRDRLELDKTGSLTITDVTTKHAGLYKLQISSSRGILFKKFSVSINSAAVSDEARKKSLMKEKNDSTERRVNESATVVMPLLNGEEVNEEKGTSSL